MKIIMIMTTTMMTIMMMTMMNNDSADNDNNDDEYKDDDWTCRVQVSMMTHAQTAQLPKVLRYKQENKESTKNEECTKQENPKKNKQTKKSEHILTLKTDIKNMETKRNQLEREGKPQDRDAW
jgi:hypothetical protein